MSNCTHEGAYTGPKRFIQIAKKCYPAKNYDNALKILIFSWESFFGWDLQMYDSDINSDNCSDTISNISDAISDAISDINSDNCSDTISNISDDSSDDSSDAGSDDSSDDSSYE